MPYYVTLPYMYATVALLTPPYASLTYTLPPEFPADFWQPGLRVAVPLGRGEPRQARYGRILAALLIYVNAMVLLLLGKGWLATSVLPAWAGLWWLLIPLALLALWLFRNDGRLRAPRRTLA